MHVGGLLALTVPATNPEESRRWWAEALGLSAYEDDPAALDVGEIAVRFGETAGVRVVASDLDGGSQRLVDPSGVVVDVVAPDYEAGRQAEESITGFIRSAGELGGPPVDELADAVYTAVLEARDRVAALLADVPHNKVLATQLALSQRGRALAMSSPPADEQWPLHAASTLMSGFVIAGSGDER